MHPMSFIVALEGSDCVVVASDGRRSDRCGNTISNDEPKVIKIGRFCVVGRTGDDAWICELEKPFTEEKMRSSGAGRPPDYVDEALGTDRAPGVIRRAAGSVLQSMQEKRWPQRTLVLLVAGYEMSGLNNARPALYRLSSDDEFRPCPTQCSGWLAIGEHAPADLGERYRRGAGVEDLTRLAVNAIEEVARTKKASVGGRTRVCVIERTNGYRELGRTELDSITQHSKELGWYREK